MMHKVMLAGAASAPPSRLKVLTIRNLSAELERRIREQAHASGTSVTKTVVRLLEERLGLAGVETIHDDLDHLAGRWTTKQAERFESSLARQRAIDPDV